VFHVHHLMGVQHLHGLVWQPMIGPIIFDRRDVLLGERAARPRRTRSLCGLDTHWQSPLLNKGWTLKCRVSRMLPSCEPLAMAAMLWRCSGSQSGTH